MKYGIPTMIKFHSLDAQPILEINGCGFGVVAIIWEVTKLEMNDFFAIGHVHRY